MSGAAHEGRLPDAAARERIQTDLDTTLFVEAAAGTGKTTALVGRILAVIRTGTSTLDRIAAVTFTEKAAGEMKLRLRTEIEILRGSDETTAGERSRLEQAIEHLELARIGTIHAFCADLLHERPIEARVDPVFEVAAEEDAQRLIDAEFDAWFESVLDSPPEGVRRLLRRRPRGQQAYGPRAALRSAVGSLVNHRDFPASWTRKSFDRDGAIDTLLARLRSVGDHAQHASDPGDYLARQLGFIARWVEEVDLQEAVSGRDYDGLEASLRDLAGTRSKWHWRGSPRKGFTHGVGRDQVLAERDAAKQELDDFLELSGANLAACLREDLRPVVLAYEARKQKEGRLDFLDLLIRARDLVRDQRDVRVELQQRFSHFFVDEFQDTDPLQAELLLLLSAEDPEANDWRRLRTVPGKLFFVGDPKQSIYRFRRADVALYETIKRRLAEEGADVVRLTTSFRSVPGIQEAVNAAFSRAIVAREDGSQADYVPLTPSRTAPNLQPAFVALPVPRPYGYYGKIFNNAIEASLPDATCAFIDWLVTDSGWTVEDKDSGSQVAIEPRHVCVLFRRMQSWGDVTRAYIHGLEARNIPHVLVGGTSFHEREEVLALRNALTAIEWPDDALSVFATLRGPFFALDDDQLLAFKHRAGTLHPLRPVASGELEDEHREVAEALAILAKLHRGRNARPIAETLHRLLHAVRAHAGIAIWPTGEQALANCLRIMDRARRFERRGAASFRAFVELLDEEALAGAGGDAPVVEEGTEGVRIMTVHKAKGLEFPVVVLADMTCRAIRDDPSQFVDASRGLWAEPLCRLTPHDLLDHRDAELERERAEATRVAYVAATRARDLLVVPAVGDEAQSGWLDVLNPAIYPSLREWRNASPAPDCPSFGQDSVFERPSQAGNATSVTPGLHTAGAGNPVVWWDPAALRLDVEPSVGLRQDKLLQADESGEVAAEGIEAHAQWHRRREDTRSTGGEPSLRVATVTALARAPAEDGEEEEHVSTELVSEKHEPRPHGVRFGALVHAALAVVALDAGESAIQEAVQSQAALLAAPGDEIAAAASAVAAVLQHPLLQRAKAAQPDVRRESPILMQEPDGGLVEGILDLAFREEHEGAGHWTVIDFKTDVELGERRSEYERQLGFYVRAVRAATGEEAQGVLLVV